MAKMQGPCGAVPGQDNGLGCGAWSNADGLHGAFPVTWEAASSPACLERQCRQTGGIEFEKRRTNAGRLGSGAPPTEIGDEALFALHQMNIAQSRRRLYANQQARRPGAYPSTGRLEPLPEFVSSVGKSTGYRGTTR